MLAVWFIGARYVFRRDAIHSIIHPLIQATPMKTITVVTFICLAVLAGCAAQDEIVSLDSRMSEIEMREAERL